MIGIGNLLFFNHFDNHLNNLNISFLVFFHQTQKEFSKLAFQYGGQTLKLKE